MKGEVKATLVVTMDGCDQVAVSVPVKYLRTERGRHIVEVSIYKELTNDEYLDREFGRGEWQK